MLLIKVFAVFILCCAFALIVHVLFDIYKERQVKKMGPSKFITINKVIELQDAGLNNSQVAYVLGIEESDVREIKSKAQKREEGYVRMMTDIAKPIDDSGIEWISLPDALHILKEALKGDD